MVMMSGGGFLNVSLGIGCQVYGKSFLVSGRCPMLGGEVFNMSVGFRVGEGKNVRFLYDDWVGIGKFWSLFPRLFRVACNKESSVKDCYFWVGSKVSWFVSFRRGLCQFEVLEYESLLSILANIFICWHEED